MKRLMMLFVAGILLVPVASNSQTVPEATSGFRLPLVNDHYGLCYKTCSALDRCPGVTYHPGVDFNGPGDDCGVDVRAVAIGIVRDVCSGAPNCTPTYANWGSIVIEHNWKGETWYSQYGHMSHVAVKVGDPVAKGQVIGKVGSVGASSCHLHWEIREADHPDPTNASYWSCTGFLSQSTIEDWYEDPEAFVATHGSYGTTPPYLCDYTNQWVNGVNVNEVSGHPGTTMTLAVTYTNVGTATWLNAGGPSGQNYVELESVTAWQPDGTGGVPANCFLDPVGWVNGRIHVVACSPASVPPSTSPTTGIATFTFEAQIPPSAAVGDYKVYFRPFHGATGLDDWGGLYWLVHVLPPTDPTNLTVIPASCSQTNSFTFNWTWSDAGASGIRHYHWNIDGVGDNLTDALTVSAPAPSASGHTFSVRAEDNAGNFSGYANASFCYQPATGPCSGRGIPNSPCMQPSDPCIGPASTANLVLLPDITMNQWSSVGMPVRAKFVAGKTYSIGFEYRSASPFDLKLGLSAVNSASSVPGFEVNTTMLPASMADWKTFWSRPFTVTFEQVREFSNLRFIRSSGETDGFEVRSVRILEIPGVQSAGSSTR